MCDDRGILAPYARLGTDLFNTPLVTLRLGIAIAVLVRPSHMNGVLLAVPFVLSRSRYKRDASSESPVYSLLVAGTKKKFVT